jgi:hypothetical protein
MRAVTRRPSPCRVSIGRAQEDQNGPTKQAHGSAAGGGRRRAGYGTAGRTRRASLRGGPTFAKKDNARRRLCTNPAGLFDWRHGVPVRATIFLYQKMILFFTRCNHQRRLFTMPKIVERFFRYSQSSRRLIMGYTFTQRGSRSEADRRPTRSRPPVASVPPDYLSPPTLPGLSTML